MSKSTEYNFEKAPDYIKKKESESLLKNISDDDFSANELSCDEEDTTSKQSNFVDRIFASCKKRTK